MQVLMNRKMGILWASSRASEMPYDAKAFYPITKPGVVLVHRGLFLRNMRPQKWRGKVPSQFVDICGYEYFMNTVHIEDYIRPKVSSIRAALVRNAAGLALEIALLRSLLKVPQGIMFTIVVDERKPICTLKFYLLRNGASAVVRPKPDDYHQPVMYINI